MSKIGSEKDAAKALKTARKLVQDLDEGWFEEEEEPQIIRKVSGILAEARSYFEALGDAGGVARTVYLSGTLARYGEDDPTKAIAYFRDAVARFEAAGAPRERYLALLEWAELDPSQPEAEQSAYDAIAAGLSSDMEYWEDPRRVAAAKQHGGDPDGALRLFDALAEESTLRGDRARTAFLLRDVARIHEDLKRDKVRATDVLETALEHAEASKDKEAIAMALLALTDIWSERRKPKVSRAYFERVAPMRGLKSYQRGMIDMMKIHFGMA